MYDVLKGIRVVDFSMFAFGPMSGAVLADWGADVVRIMNPAFPDLMQTNASAVPLPPPKVDVAFGWEMVNRGKRSFGLDSTTPDGRKLLTELIAASDVFITNFLPPVRRKLGIEVEDVRAANPKIIYARASGFGPRGAEAGKPGFDHTAFWARSGIAHANMQIADEFIPQLSPAFGDVLSGLALAGGIAAALLRRERGGEPAIVDTSLLHTGMFAYGAGIAASRVHDIDAVPRMRHAKQTGALTNAYQTKDGRQILFAGGHKESAWTNLFEVIGRPELKADARFADKTSREKNAAALIKILDEVFAARTFADWLPRLEKLEVPWCPVQNAREVAADPQALANDYVVEVESAKGQAFSLVPSPVQFDLHGARLRRAPQLGEHTDAVLRELGRSEAEIRRLRAEKTVV
jgi:crotonobetainyl-CoA:carnitine CoA-transferase CaiB-like acyl-CoA transferase